MEAYCPMCGTEDLEFLGILGRLAWFRCRLCGDTFSVDAAAIAS